MTSVVPRNTNPNVTTEDGEVINTNTLGSLILMELDELYHVVYDKEIDAKERGKIVGEKYDSIRSLVIEQLNKAFKG